MVQKEVKNVPKKTIQIAQIVNNRNTKGKSFLKPFEKNYNLK